MRSGNPVRRSAFRLVRAGINNAEVALGTSLDDAGVLRIIAKEVGEHRESIEEFTKGGRQDLVDQAEAELGLLLAYLPQQMSAEEIRAAARR